VTRTKLSTADVVDAAVVLADEDGLDAVSLAAIARRLGVQTPSLYSHVRDLAALRDAMTERALGELGARISLAIAGCSGGEALHGFADAHRAFARDCPGRWEALQRRAGEAVAASQAARTVVALTSAVLRGYALAEEEHVHAIRLIGSTINGFITLEARGSFDHTNPAPDASWQRTVEALDTLLRHWPTDTTHPEETR